MSEQHPPSGGPAPVAGEAWDTAGPQPRRRARRTATVTAVSVAVVAVLGGGALAAVQLFGGGGPQPAEALPARTVALLTVDLDPAATQKIAAFRTLRKFPGLKKQLGLGDGDDPRRSVFEDATRSGSCKGLDFDRDIKPWLGERAAVGAVDLGARTPVPVLALQVSDADRATAGVAKVAACGHPGKDFGYVVSRGYLLISDSSDHARTIAAAAKAEPLSDDPSYRRWSTAAGDAGVVNVYVGRRAAQLLADNLDRLGATGFPFMGFGPSVSPATATLQPSAAASPAAYHPAGAGMDPFASVKRALAKFQGMGGALRFADGGVELEVASGGTATQHAAGGAVGRAVGRLPMDTALAVGFGTPPDYAKNLAKGLSSAMGGASQQLLGTAERQLGITLPGDLQTLLGKAVTLSLGGNAPADLSSIAGPADLPLALSVTGDPTAIQAVVAKIEKRTGHSLAEAQLVTRTKGDTFTVATNSGYADQLQQQGGLGDSDTFRGAVPNADKATSLLYVDFDSPWVASVVHTFGFSSDAAVNANLAPLKALGVSAWSEGDVAHALVKLTTD